MADPRRQPARFFRLSNVAVRRVSIIRRADGSDLTADQTNVVQRPHVNHAEIGLGPGSPLSVGVKGRRERAKSGPR